MFGLIVACFFFFLSFFNQAIDSDRKRKELREQTQCVTSSIGNNDFDYEDKQKTQDSIPVYEGLHFNLTAEHSKKFFFPLSVKSKLIVCYWICLCDIYSPPCFFCLQSCVSRWKALWIFGPLFFRVKPCLLSESQKRRVVPLV